MSWLKRVTAAPRSFIDSIVLFEKEVDDGRKEDIGRRKLSVRRDYVVDNRCPFDGYYCCRYIDLLDYIDSDLLDCLRLCTETKLSGSDCDTNLVASK